MGKILTSLLVTIIVRSVATSGDEMLLQTPCYSPEGCFLAEEQKRAQEVLLPCACESMPRLLDLGREYSPRYLPAVTCAGGCWHGPYQCRHRFYEVKVLKRRDKADDVSGRHDLSLPESLRDLWKFVLVKVVVACECSL